jgi:hypothetical protein
MCHKIKIRIPIPTKNQEENQYNLAILTLVECLLAKNLDKAAKRKRIPKNTVMQVKTNKIHAKTLMVFLACLACLGALSKSLSKT